MKISSIIPLFSALAAVRAQIALGPVNIRSLASDEQTLVGRSFAEDRSLFPKPILLLNNGGNDVASGFPSPIFLFLISFSGISPL